MPVGVTVTTDVLQPAGGLDTSDAAAYFVVGVTERGDTAAPVLVRSMREYRDKLGDRVSYGSVDDSASCYFGEGGSRLYVGRMVGSSATKGTLTLADRAGSPVSTVRVDAQNAGAWSANVSVKVDDGIVANTVTISILYKGAVQEVYSNLLSPAAIVTALANSNYVRAADLASATASPNNLPAVLAATALSAGSDDRGTLGAADYVTALGRFTADYGPGIVAVPGQTMSNSTISAGLLAHCNTYRRVGAAALAVGQAVSTATTLARTLRASTGADSVGLFYPWVTMPDGAGGVRTVSPEGFVAGVRARAILDAGWPVPPFGEAGKAQYVLGAEVTLNSADSSTLADAAVNPIRVMPLAIGGTRLYDWRSLSVDEANWKFLDYRDLLNAIASEVSLLMERHVGVPIDGAGHLFSAMENDAESVLAPMSDTRLFAKFDADGNQLDPGYQLITDETVNTPTTIANGEAHIRINVRPAPDAELISVQISKATVQNSL